MLFNPFTGTPRHPDDIKSDPDGFLLWDGEARLHSAQAAQPAQDGWIPVGERLPKPYEEVMVWPIPSNNSRTADINTIGTWRYGEYELNFGWTENVCEVTHWMPLPAAPEAT